ncbi:MAG: amino acid adenylation domain-containing protein [Erysipelotrichaceae bacterium]|nr:amino acid adenylation domain-containing protein [Erysipelotrichaceae bacterium]
MIHNVLQLLEKNAISDPEKIALRDENDSVTYREYHEYTRRIGTYIAHRCNCRNKPVAVFIDRTIHSIMSFMGIAYSGNFYVPIDPTMPKDRIDLIFGTLNPVMIIACGTNALTEEYDTVPFTEAAEAKIDELLLKTIREDSLDVDPLYSIFTSGSTGVPKGVLTSHRSVLDLVGAFQDAFSFPKESVFGNQAPFDFDGSNKDIYNALNCGGTVQIVPKKYFKMPKLLVDFLRDRKVTSLIWVVSALRIVADFQALDEAEPLNLENVMFSGEVMPVKSLNYWMEHVPGARYVNLYGPTEITCNCSYYVVERRYANDETLPIGKAFRNSRVFLMNEQGQKITEKNQMGEICVAGSCLALGYWNAPEVTSRAFINDPMVPEYSARIYKTGDLGFYNDRNELMFVSRKDNQVKHMGHRIELGEIEVALNSIDLITIACCVYDKEHEKIVCFYQSKEADQERQIALEMMKKLPKYMCPNVYIRYDRLPMNKNGKIDRVKLKESLKEQ